MDFVDYYAELGVPRTATKEEIQKAYRALARTYHPDRNKEAGAEDKFKQVAEAYEVLGDEDNRKKYDQYGATWKASSNGGSAPPGFEGFDFSNRGGRAQYTGGTGFSDFFETFFGRAGPDPFGAPRDRGPRKGANHEARIALTVEEAFRGGRREVTLTDPSTGNSRKYVVTIPKGIRGGQKIRLKGQGGTGALGGRPGDLMLVVELKPSASMRIEGSDVYTTVSVAPWTAALGGQADLHTLDGTVSVSIPPGSSSGRKIRLKGKGFPGVKGSEPGDLYAEIKIVVPKQLTERERELFEELAEESEFSPGS